MTDHTDPSERDAPEGWRRRDDGILEQAPGAHYHRRDPGEAVMGHHKGERRLVCTEMVWSRGGSFHSSICGKTPKHDPDHNGNPTKCGIHCVEAKNKRKAKSEAKYESWRAEQDRKAEMKRLASEAAEIVRQVADGHNDPRSICADWCARMDKIKEQAND